MTNNNIKIYTNLLVQLDRLHRHNRQGSFKTRERYYKAMKRFCRFLADIYRLERLANIAPKHLYGYASYMKGKGLSASTIKTDLAAIRFWHDQMPRANCHLPGNDMLNLERRSFGKQDRTWSIPEFNRFLGVCLEHNREDYAAVARLARYAGLRLHECFRVDTAIAEDAARNMAISIKGKGGKVRTVPIDEAIRNELVRILSKTKRGHKLFVRDDIETHLEMNSLQQFIASHRQEIQDPDSLKPLTFHGLRHTYALQQYEKLILSGCSDTEARFRVSYLLGHNRADVTRIYLAGLKSGDRNV